MIASGRFAARWLCCSPRANSLRRRLVTVHDVMVHDVAIHPNSFLIVTSFE
jgi:hypothetical protein